MEIKEYTCCTEKRVQMDYLYPKTGEKGGWVYVTLENKDQELCAVAAMKF